jgi:hypothetical protein
MTSVVIVHAAEDALPARALAEKLRAAQLIPVIEKYGADVREAARSAKVVIALWSPRSVGEAGLIEDVDQIGGKVVQASMQNAAPPAQFAGGKLFNLTGWRGEDDFRPWRELAEEVTNRAGVSPLPEPARGGSAFFQPGRSGPIAGAPAATAAPRPTPPPQPRAAAPPPQRAEARSAPRADADEKKGSPIGIIAIVLIVLAAIGGGGYWYMNQTQDSATASAWEDVAQNDAGEIRAFLNGNPGEYRDEAQAALAELDQQTFDAAQEADSIEAFEVFLQEFPDSENAIAARGRIAELRANPPVDPDAQPAEGETSPTETTPADPDLVPPGAVTPLPEPEPSGDSGPATLTPPTLDPTAPTTP